MKILYGAGNRIGAYEQLIRFLEDTSHEVKVASYFDYSPKISNWILDPLLYKEKNGKLKHIQYKNNYKIPQQLYNDIEEWKPDLIISDCDTTTINIGHDLNIETWCCSGCHLLDGISKHYTEKKEYLSSLQIIRFHLMSMLKNKNIKRKLIYNPWSNLEIREGYECVKPFYYKTQSIEKTEKIAIINDIKRINILAQLFNSIYPYDIILFTNKENASRLNISHINICSDMNIYKEYLGATKWFFTTGNCSNIADAIYNDITTLCIAPSLMDAESLINASIANTLGIGYNIGQVEKMEWFAKDELESTFTLKTNNILKNIRNNKSKTLSELL